MLNNDVLLVGTRTLQFFIFNVVVYVFDIRSTVFDIWSTVFDIRSTVFDIDSTNLSKLIRNGEIISL